jgi:hypothetical protein
MDEVSSAMLTAARAVKEALQIRAKKQKGLLKPSSPQALKPSSPQALKPSSPQALAKLYHIFLICQVLFVGYQGTPCILFSQTDILSQNFRYYCISLSLLLRCKIISA